MKILPIALIALTFAFFAPASQAATIFSDNFNAEHGGTGIVNYTGFAKWNVSNGAVDLIGNGFFDFFPGNGLYVDLDGTVFKAGLLSSTPIALATGTYTIQFALGGSHRGDTNTVRVTLGSFLNETFTLAAGDPLATITRTITVGGPTSASLTFQNDGGDNMGAILDNVSVDSATTEVPVPETHSISLLAMGLTGIGLLQRMLKLRSSN